MAKMGYVSGVQNSATFPPVALSEDDGNQRVLDQINLLNQNSLETPPLYGLKHLPSDKDDNSVGDVNHFEANYTNIIVENKS